MKYTLHIDIARPRATVVELFDNPDNWPHWQDSQVRSEALAGTPGDRGATTKLTHKFGRRDVEMVETIESKHLPDEMTCVYEAPGAWNRVIYRFAEIGPNTTRWTFDTEFRCRGFLRILAFVVPGMFRRASVKDMTNFKTFVESTASRGSRP